jgi:hypothetical protein
MHDDGRRAGSRGVLGPMHHIEVSACGSLLSLSPRNPVYMHNEHREPADTQAVASGKKRDVCRQVRRVLSRSLARTHSPRTRWSPQTGNLNRGQVQAP